MIENVFFARAFSIHKEKSKFEDELYRIQVLLITKLLRVARLYMYNVHAYCSLVNSKNRFISWSIKEVFYFFVGVFGENMNSNYANVVEFAFNLEYLCKS